MRIRWRLMLGLLLLVAGGFFYLISWIIDDLRPRYLEAVEEALVDEANILATYVEQSLVSDTIQPLTLRRVFHSVQKRQFHAQIYKLDKTGVDLRVYVTDKHGMVLFDSKNGESESQDFSRWRDVYLTLRGSYGARTSPTIPGDVRSTTLYVGAPVTYGGEIVGVLTVCKPTTNINFFVESAKPQIVIAGTVAAVGVILLSLILSVWLTIPIKRLTFYARKVRDGKLAAVPKIRGGEVGELAQAFEEMRDSLEGKRYVEQTVQNLTHEIKSPLSGIRGASELLSEPMCDEQRKRFIGNIINDASRIQEIVDRMLQLASVESRKVLDTYEAVNLGELIGMILAEIRPQIQNAGLLVNWQQTEKTIYGDLFLVRQAILNLLKNAIEFSSKDGRISISISESNENIALSIEDEGAGIPDYANEKVFEKFYSLPRPQSNKKSSGLGLNFVRSVMALHGGGVSVENHSPKGVVARLLFPKDPPIKI